MLKEGSKAPDFSLPADDGSIVSLKKLKGKTVILYFYPKDMTPGCTAEACDFRDAYPKLAKGKVEVLGVSKDSIERHVKFKEKYDLNFPLLSDEDGTVCKAYGVWQKKSLYGKSFMGIIRSTFVIDPKGVIQKIYSKVKVKDHVKELVVAHKVGYPNEPHSSAPK